MGDGRITIRDVAERAGVSVPTVSRVLNDRYGVSAATSARVRAVIEELGFESSLVARSLRNHQTKVIGVLVWAIEPFAAEVLKGAAQAISNSGYELVIYSSGGNSEDRLGWERRSLSRLSGTLVDAAVLVTPTVSSASFGIPIVAIDPHVGTREVPSISADNDAGARAATRHLVELGHQRIAFLGRPPRDLESSQERETGYRTALDEAGIAIDPRLIVSAEYDDVAARTAIRELLEPATRPTAVFAANDMSAITTMEVAQALGLRVPDDLSVVGFDNVPESVLAEPPLTTVEQPMKEMGRRAVEMVIDLLADREPADIQLRLPTRLIQRESTSTPAN